MTSEEEAPERETLGGVVWAVLAFGVLVLGFVLFMRFVFPGDVSAMPALPQRLLGRTAYQLGKAVREGWGGVGLRLGWSAMAMFSVLMLSLALKFAVDAFYRTIPVFGATRFASSFLVGAAMPWLLVSFVPVLEYPVAIACLLFWCGGIWSRFMDALDSSLAYARGE